jgi:single-strand DNA-binding protein
VSFNKIIVIGNVGTDPEMRYTPSGVAVTSFRIAVGRSYNSQDGERKQETEWFTVNAWDKLAEQVNQYLVKGRRAFVEGRFQSHSYQGNDGQMRLRNEIVANRVIFLDRPSSGENYEDYGNASSISTQEFYGSEANSPEDLPF